MRLNLHLHGIQLDGVFVEGAEGEEPTFHALPAPKPVEVQQLAWEVCQRTTRLLQKRGLYLGAGPDSDTGAAPDEADTLASSTGWVPIPSPTVDRPWLGAKVLRALDGWAPGRTLVLELAP